MTIDIQFIYSRRNGINYRISPAALDIVALGQLGNFGSCIWWNEGPNQFYGFEYVPEIGEWVEYMELERREEMRRIGEAKQEREARLDAIKAESKEQLRQAELKYRQDLRRAWKYDPIGDLFRRRNHNAQW